MATVTKEFVYVKFEITDGHIFVYVSKNSPPLKVIVLDTREENTRIQEPHSTVLVIHDSTNDHDKFENYDSDNKKVDENVDYEHTCLIECEMDTYTHYDSFEGDSPTNSDNEN